MSIKMRAAAWLPLLVLGLQACGGGGGGEGGGAGPPPAQALPAPPAPSALSYPNPQVYDVGVAITPLDPAVTGSVASYSVSPRLPAGLSLDAATGRISGTPAAASRSSAYTVTATNPGGSTSFALTLAVLLERATADRADEVTGRQVHVMYVVPSGNTDEQLDRTGTLQASVQVWRSWFATQTGGTELRLDTYDGGKPDVTYLALAKTHAEMDASGSNVRTRLEYQLLAYGFDSPDKVYLVYYGGDGDGCGRGAWPPTLHGSVGALYVGAASGCTGQPFAAGDQPPGFLEFLAVHEVLHVLGFAAPCAPHHTENGHVGDSVEDVMFAGGQSWRPATLDVNHDDYYGAAVPGCRDLANSDLLDPLPAGAEAPAGWPYENLADLGCANEPTIAAGPYGPDTQVTFVNRYTVNGAPSAVTISELVLDTTTGLWVRAAKVTVPYDDGAPVPGMENAVFVATVNGTCVGLVRATAAPSRFVVRP